MRHFTSIRHRPIPIVVLPVLTHGANILVLIILYVNLYPLHL